MYKPHISMAFTFILQIKKYLFFLYIQILMTDILQYISDEAASTTVWNGCS